MVKKKTSKSVKSRVKLTGTGKLRRRRPGRRHLLTHKSSKRKRKLRKSAPVHETIVKSYKNLIGA